MSKSKHLTLSQRITIELGLNHNRSFKSIAAELNKDPSTISKEVRNHRQKVRSGAFGRSHNSCVHRFSCTYSSVCSKPNCYKNYCRTCSYCNNSCSFYTEDICQTLSLPPYVCNGCNQRTRCSLFKFEYRAEASQKQYQLSLSSSRSGCSLSEQQLSRIDQVLTPLLKQGHSPYHIWTNNKDQLMIDSRTLYNYINKGYLDSIHLDLPKALRYRPRQGKKGFKIDKKCRVGRTFDDFHLYMSQNHEPHYVEMDTMVGSPGGKVLLTITFPLCSFMIAFLREANDSQSVISIFNELYVRLGHTLFTQLFPVILTDNGSKFSNPSAIEFVDSDCTIRRTRLFYSRSSTSSDKPHIERNHIEFRRICPKQTSVDNFTQDTVNLIFSHINSYARKKLNNKSPLMLFSHLFGDNLHLVFGITEIQPNNVILNPSLIR